MHSPPAAARAIGRQRRLTETSQGVGGGRVVELMGCSQVSSYCWHSFTWSKEIKNLFFIHLCSAGVCVRQAKGGAQAQVQRRRAGEEADDDVRPNLLQPLRGASHEQLQLQEDLKVTL